MNQLFFPEFILTLKKTKAERSQCFKFDGSQNLKSDFDAEKIV